MLSYTTSANQTHPIHSDCTIVTYCHRIQLPRWVYCIIQYHTKKNKQTNKTQITRTKLPCRPIVHTENFVLLYCSETSFSSSIPMRLAGTLVMEILLIEPTRIIPVLSCNILSQLGKKVGGSDPSVSDPEWLGYV